MAARHCTLPPTTARRSSPWSLVARAAALLVVCLAPLLPLAGCQPAGPGADRSISRPRSSSETQPPLPSGRNTKRSSASAQVVQARSLRVQDGDSFIVSIGSGSSRRTVRISGIDAPERFQPHADQSRRSLNGLVAGHDLELKVDGTDQYGRIIAQVFVVRADGKAVDVGLTQLESGMAWYFRRYQRDLPPASRESYDSAERRARKARKGLWQESEPEPPWDFRRRGR